MFHASRAQGRTTTALGVVARLSMVLLFLGLPLGLLASPASASSQISVSINPNQQTALSGADMDYDVQLDCSAVDESVCKDVEITIPLPSEIEAATVGSLPGVTGVTSTYVRGSGATNGLLTITFSQDITAGTTVDIPLTMHTQNGTTPNGFHWDIPVTVTSSNAATVTADASGTVTASAQLALKKYVVPTTVQVDHPVKYFITVCDPTNPNSPGRLDLASGSLVDTLPNGLTAADIGAISAGGVYSAANNAVTWPLTNVQLRDCTANGQFWVTVTYPSATFGTQAPLITDVTNRADATALPYGETTSLTANDSVTSAFVTLDSGPVGVFAKAAHTAPPLDANGSAHPIPQTYPGDWIPAGFEAEWDLLAANPGTAAYEPSADDRLPCAYAAAGRSQNTSPLPGESVCTKPTFITEQVRIPLDGQDTGPFSAITDGARAAILTGWTPTYTTTSGAIGNFVLATKPSVNALSTHEAVFTVPTLAPGDEIAEVHFPANAGITVPGGQATPGNFMRILGHMRDNDATPVFQDVSGGDPVVNTADMRTVVQGQVGPDIRRSARIDVLLPSIRAGLDKTITGNDVRLDVGVVSPTPVSGVVVTDLLPPNVTVQSVDQLILWNPSVLQSGISNPAAFNVEVLNNYDGSGRQLLRVTLRPGFTPLQMISLPYNITVVFTTQGLAPTQVPFGVTVNTAQVHLPGDAIDSCYVIDDSGRATGDVSLPLTQDPFDLDGDGLGSSSKPDSFCQGQAQVSRAIGGAQLQVQKLVRGDLDSSFQGFPTVGSVDSGGTARFRIQLTNQSGGTDLNNVVAYDLLPRVGDTGVKLIGTPRGSQFAAQLAGTPTVTGAPNAVIEYATAVNPCRGELNQQAENAWPAGCSPGAWSAVPPADLTQVTGLRLSGLGDLAPSVMPNVTLTYPVKVPNGLNAGEVAWNSVAVAADRTDTGAAILPTEPPKVGLAVPLTDVQLAKTVNGGDEATVQPGSTVTYKIYASHGTNVVVNPDGSVTYFNPAGSAPSTARNVVVRDVVPAGVTLVPGTWSTSCGDASFQGHPILSPGGTFDESTQDWTVGDIAPGQMFELCFKATVTGTPTSNTLRNIAQVTVEGPADIDSSPNNLPPGTLPQEDDEADAVVHVLAPILSVNKSVSPPDGSTVKAGDPLTYSLTFSNTGSAPGQVNFTDDLSKVLDDADVTAQPSSSDPALTASAISNGRFTVTGSLAAGKTVTVTYQVKVKPDGQRGDDDLLNFVFPTGGQPPATCQAGDPLCTENPVPELHVVKDVNPADGSTVKAGDVLTYTLTFSNTGKAAGQVDYEDVIGGVLDDATVVTPPTSSDQALSVSAIAGGRFRIHGTLQPSQHVTVTYQVQVLPDGQRGDNQLDNFVVTTGAVPPATCQTGDPLCTHNPVPGVGVVKSVDPLDGSTVTTGELLTYSLTFSNTGKAAGQVDYEDVVSGVLDDATLVGGPTASDPALTVSPVSNGRFRVTGTLQPNQSVTVSYQVSVNEKDKRGDDDLLNFVVTTGGQPPVSCPAGNPLCTENPVSQVSVVKTVDPSDGSTVKAGDVLTYSLAFANDGLGAAQVDYVDDLKDVLDDATFVTGSIHSHLLKVSGPAGDKLHITGTLRGGQTTTVTYQVKVRPDGQRGNNVLENFVLLHGQPTPVHCQPGDDHCTSNPVGQVGDIHQHHGGSPQIHLPNTGGPRLIVLLVAVGLVLAGAGLLLSRTVSRAARR